MARIEAKTETQWKTARSRPVELIVPVKVEEEKKMKKIELFWKDHESHSESETELRKERVGGIKSDSESLRRIDSKSGSGYDSAGNKTTVNKVALRLGRVSYRSSLISRKRFSMGKPGSKKRQRWLNQIELGRKEDELFDKGSYDAWRIFFSEQKGSAFKVLFENPSLRALWREFLDVTEEEQERMFLKLGLSHRYHLNEESSHAEDNAADDQLSEEDANDSSDPEWRREDRDTPFDYQSLFLEDPELSFKRVEKDMRKILHRKGHDSCLVRTIDHALLSFLSMEMHTPEIPFFSESFAFLHPEALEKIDQRLIVRSDDRVLLQLIIPDSFNRLMTHNVCKYYGLRSQSFEDEEGGSCVLIGPLDETQFPRKSLAQYLFGSPSDADSLYWSSSSSSRPQRKSKKRSKSTSHKQTDTRTAKALERRERLLAEGAML